MAGLTGTGYGKRRIRPHGNPLRQPPPGSITRGYPSPLLATETQGGTVRQPQYQRHIGGTPVPGAPGHVRLGNQRPGPSNDKATIPRAGIPGHNVNLQNANQNIRGLVAQKNAARGSGRENLIRRLASKRVARNQMLNTPTATRGTRGYRGSEAPSQPPRYGPPGRQAPSEPPPYAGDYPRQPILPRPDVMRRFKRPRRY